MLIAALGSSTVSTFQLNDHPFPARPNSSEVSTCLRSAPAPRRERRAERCKRHECQRLAAVHSLQTRSPAVLASHALPRRFHGLLEATATPG
eukprot:1003003-Pyramimonas_sp.AAC.2